MTTNAIAISRGLVEAGIERTAADAIAEAVVTHSDESFATKADIARLEAKIARLEAKVDTRIGILENKVNILMVLNVGVLIAILASMVAG